MKASDPLRAAGAVLADGVGMIRMLVTLKYGAAAPRRKTLRRDAHAVSFDTHAHA